jgi:DNA-binding transcriptional MerR regulator
MLEKDKVGNFLSDEQMEILRNLEYSSEFPLVAESMEKPNYTISDLNISPRDATYWDKQGILPTVKGPGMRRKYDIPQSIWIKLIQQMRSLGIGLTTIKKLKNNLLDPGDDIFSICTEEELKKIISTLQPKFDITNNVDELISDLRENAPTLFISIVIATIIFREATICLVNKDGEFILLNSNKYEMLVNSYVEFAEFVAKPHFCISISEAYKSLVNEWSTHSSFEKTPLLSKTELSILETIRKPNVSSINIRFKEGEPYLIEIDNLQEVSIEQRFLDVITKNGFQKISITTQNGKIVHFENKIQMKLNKSTK